MIERKAAYNSTFAIGGVSCSTDNLVVTESSVLRMNICAEKPAHRKSAKRYASCLGDSANFEHCYKKLTLINKNRQDSRKPKRVSTIMKYNKYENILHLHCINRCYSN